MKKILIGACAVMLGIAASASSVSWGVTTGQTLDTTKVDAGTMYLVYASDATRIDWTALSGVTEFNEGTIAAVGFDQTIATFTYDSSTSTVNTKTTITPSSSGLAAGAYDMYMICIDDDGKDIAYTASPKSINIKATAMSAAGTVGSSSFSYATAVPEPTSGLLLLLGMAGLALKRKIA